MYWARIMQDVYIFHDEPTDEVLVVDYGITRVNNINVWKRCYLCESGEWKDEAELDPTDVRKIFIHEDIPTEWNEEWKPTYTPTEQLKLILLRG